MKTMRVAQVSRPGGPLELVERPIPDPGPGSVRIKVQACGICHSDAMTKVVLATVTHGPAMSATVGGLAPRGRLMVLGAAESLETSPFLLIGGRRSVEGWYAGTSIDSEDTLAFSVQSGVRPMNEVYPLERAAEAYDRMMSGKARFRVVLTM